MLSLFNARTIGCALYHTTCVYRDRVKVTYRIFIATGQLIYTAALNAIEAHLRLLTTAAPG